MKYYLIALYVALAACTPQKEIKEGSDNIRVNQIGYFTNGEKIAAVINSDANSFDIVDSKTKKSVYSGALSEAKTWEASGEEVKLADFSDFTKNGNYVVMIDTINSYPFSISEKASEPVIKGALKAYYYNRASMALEDTFAGIYKRPLAHPDDSVVVHPSAASEGRPAGSVISSPKGWYDAGDYGKYVVNSGISTYTLMAAYEAYPGLFDTLTFDIPESSNDIPDILDEARWNIDWMATMQDPVDGGVYHKLTTANFQGAEMPETMTAVRYVVAKGTSASLNLAAVLAMASRVYAPYDEEASTKYLKQAMQAWEWAIANDSIPYKNVPAQDGSPAVTTGEYGDKKFNDEFHWAATELYITTKNEAYLEYLDFDQQFGIPHWYEVSTLSLLSLARNQDEISEELKQQFKAPLMLLADTFQTVAENHAIKIPEWKYNWGSNSNFGNVGMVFMHVYELTKDKKYLSAAMGAQDYMLGRNGTGYSYVTGFGTKTPQFIHHRVSEADSIEAPVPGFIAGGPNPNNQDMDCGADMYPSTLPAKSYIDHWCSFSSNEITINWNAPLVYVTGGLQAEHLK